MQFSLSNPEPEKTPDTQELERMVVSEELTPIRPDSEEPEEEWLAFLDSDPEPVRTAAELLEIGYWCFSKLSGEFSLSAKARDFLALERNQDGLSSLKDEISTSERLERVLEVALPSGIGRVLVQGWLEYPNASRMVGILMRLPDLPEPSEIAESSALVPEPHPLLLEAMEYGTDSLLVLKAILNLVGDAVDFEVVEANTRGAQLLGGSRATVLGRLIRQLAPSMEEDGTISRYAEIMRTGRTAEDEFHVSPGGFARIWIRQRIVPLKDGVAIFAADVTGLKLADETADRSRRMFERIAVTTPDALLLWDVDTRRLVYDNGQLGRYLELTNELVRLHEIEFRVESEDAPRLRDYLADLASSADNTVRELVVQGKSQVRPKHLLFRSSVFDRTATSRPRTIVTTVQDVTEQFEYRAVLETRVKERDLARTELESKNRQLEELNERLSMLALTDPTTGIKNRRAFQEKLDEETERAQRYNHRLALLLTDIDRFKVYNDTYGHPAGDQALKGFAQVLVEVCRRSDTVARYGGEEFGVILPNTGSREAGMLGERIRRALANTVFGAQGLTASIGCAEFLPGKDSKERLVSEADQALYRSKNNGRNQVRVFGD